jgi:hypothetical protein
VTVVVDQREVELDLQLAALGYLEDGKSDDS